MFKNLFDLSFKRTGVQAIGFYIVYNIIFGVLAGLISGMVAVAIMDPNAAANYDEGYKIGIKIGVKFGPIIGTMLVSVVSVWILIAKKNYKHFGAIILSAVSICLTYILGGIIGMIPVAILTTFDDNSAS